MKGTSTSLRIAVIAPLRYPIREPHAGGLESSIWHQIDHLRARGHHVVLCAVAGSDFMENSPPEFVMPPAIWADDECANDTDYPAGYLEAALPALERALDYLRAHTAEFDVVHNHSLHGAPLRRAADLGIPMVSTLHTPVLPELVEASSDAQGSSFIAVSSHTAHEWAQVGVSSLVLPNAVDDQRWALGPGGDDLVWFGRIVLEKGPHLAIETARLLGRRLVLAGRVGDPAYAEALVWPHLGSDVVYAGDLRQSDLAALVGKSACVLVTPTWEEPFGLIIVEALMTGTPVATFGAGGIHEVVAGLDGALVASPGDCVALAGAAQALIDTVSGADSARALIRQQVVQRYSLDSRIEQLEALYRQAAETTWSEPAA
jgi:glycosyltransferase involved in cell wall biosynthesis